MKPRVGFAAVWVVTTAAGIMISWAGVGDAMRGTSSPELVVGGLVRQSRPPTPGPSPTPRQDTLKPSSRPPEPSTSPTSNANPSRSSRPPAASSGETVRTYSVRHGRVTVALGRDSARLVSTAPNSGSKATVWRKPTWLRVDLQNGTSGSAVFVTWGDHPPIVEFHEY